MKYKTKAYVKYNKFHLSEKLSILMYENEIKIFKSYGIL